MDVGQSHALELVAHRLGHRGWNTAAALLPAREGAAGQPRTPIPVQRVQDGRAALDSYVDQLGLSCLGGHLPLSLSAHRDQAVLDLSE